MIKGKVIAKKLNQQLKNKIAKLDKQPELAIISIAKNSSASLYQKMIIKHCKEVGINPVVFNIGLTDNPKKELYTLIHKNLNINPVINGILIEKPYHIDGLDEQTADDWITYNKDVDGTNSANVARLFYGKPSMLPCTPQAIVNLLKSNHISIKGKKVTIINRSNIIGKPLALYMINNGAEVSVFNHYATTEQLKSDHADIVIAATGVADLINSKMVSRNQVLVPVSEVRKDGKLHGDFSKEAIKKAYGFSCTGNVGPLNITSLLRNTYKEIK